MTSNDRRRRPSGPSRDRDRGALQTSRIIGIVVALVVVVAGAVAIISATGSDDSHDTMSTSPSGVVEAQNRPVVVTGNPLAPLAEDGSNPMIGTTIPTVTGQSFDGTAVTIEPGTPTLVLFVAHWCPHCRIEVPRLVSWASDGGVPSGVDVIGVSTAVTDQRDNYPPSNWLRDESFPWPVMADGPNNEAAGAFGVSAFPFFVLYDADGKVALRTSGELDTSQLTGMITAALAA